MTEKIAVVAELPKADIESLMVSVFWGFLAQTTQQQISKT